MHRLDRLAAFCLLALTLVFSRLETFSGNRNRNRSCGLAELQSWS